MLSKKIMVVDDNALIRYSISRLLEDNGYAPVEAVDGEDALNKLYGTDNISMVITDLNMPRLNGVDLTIRLRQDQVYKSMPVIMMSAEAYEDAKKSREMAGADELISKPFMSEELIDAVRKYISQNKTFSLL